MSSKNIAKGPGRFSRRPLIINAAIVSVTALTVAACIHEQGPMVAGWAITDPAQRHPIMVSKQPETLALRVTRGAQGLSPHQRAQLIGFVERYGARDAGNSRLVIRAPSGTLNEVAAMQAVAEIRDLLRDSGFDESSISIEAAHGSSNAQPPIHVSYLQYVAEAPECGHWGSNLAKDPLNVGVPNLGCATQANFAAMVANPADLLGPRNETARASERRDVTWDKYVKGDSTVARKTEDERAKVDVSK